MINIYCDESCHLELDNSPCMVLGAISCPKQKVAIIAKDLRELKRRHGLSDRYELKWTKVGTKKIDYYKAVIMYFVNSDDIRFRAIVADKTDLRHSEFSQTHDDWYYKMYYLLLRQMVSPSEEYKIYLDIKDTQGGDKVLKLQDVLNYTLYKFYDETVRGIQQIRSNESELLQMADLFIGAVAYMNRKMFRSQSKTDICRYLESSMATSLISTTPLSQTKFNIFVWESRYK